MAISESKSFPKIVIVDGHTLNPGDLSWQPLENLGTVEVYAHSTRKELLDRADEAEIVLANKAILDAEIMNELPKLRCICVTATGFDNIDIQAAENKGITVCNAAGYGTPAVAQHVFALLLELTNAVGRHNQSVQHGNWSLSRDFCYTLQPLVELAGKTMGIYGFGKIGQQVAVIAQAFGMKVLATHKHPERDAMPGMEFIDLQALFSQSDVVTLHAPLTDENAEIINKSLLTNMKRTAYLINTARGGLINESDLQDALENGTLAGAGLDVLSEEPPKNGNVLFNAKNCIITPHNAWASREARQRLLNETVKNVQAFLNGKPRNVIC